MVLGKNILQALFLKGTSNVPQGKKKKDSTFELQGFTREISLSKAVKMESYFRFQGKRPCWLQSGINLKSGWRKMQKISKSLNLYHKIAKHIMTWGRNFFKAHFPVLYDSQGKLTALPTSSLCSSLKVLPTSSAQEKDPTWSSSLLLGYMESYWLSKEQKARPQEGGSHSYDGSPLEVLSRGSNSPNLNFPLLNRPHPDLGCKDVCFLWQYSCGVAHEKDTWGNPASPAPTDNSRISTFTQRKVAPCGKPRRGRPAPSLCRFILNWDVSPFPCLSPHLSSWCQLVFVTLSIWRSCSCVWCYCQEHTCSCLHYSHLRADCSKKYSWK